MKCPKKRSLGLQSLHVHSFPELRCCFDLFCKAVALRVFHRIQWLFQPKWGEMLGMGRDSEILLLHEVGKVSPGTFAERRGVEIC